MSIRFNPFTGNFDFVGDGGGGGTSVPNFSFLKVTSPLTIPTGQQMLFSGNIEVSDILYLDGDLFEILEREPDFMFLSVPANDCLTIPSNQRHLFSEPFEVDGDLVLNGQLMETVL